MRVDDEVRLRHMIDAAQAAIRFIEGRSRSDLESDQLLLFGIVRAIEVVGEAASKLSEATRARAPNIPWPAIVSMRNRLIHGYFDDADVVWKTATKELPALLSELRTLANK